ncbi:MAG: hypothetical protein A3J83_03585 [Elusimicrobia bacterium RIFOXYA2_FULL_40_6]|nr:MAG: hypothetical protein A3J83_03585 [Elusimicrobia bacterium RIFOXYA2_FULL_40_6]
MTIKKSFKILKWADWDHEINTAVGEFYSKYKHYPNIFLTNACTYIKMDAYTNKTQRQRKNCTDRNTSKPPKASDTGELHSFVGKGYNLEFCLDEKLPDNYFYLVFDPKAKIISNTKRDRHAKPTKKPA